MDTYPRIDKEANLNNAITFIGEVFDWYFRYYEIACVAPFSAKPQVKVTALG